jgi:hypothetical protein
VPGAGISVRTGPDETAVMQVTVIVITPEGVLVAAPQTCVDCP